MLKLRTNEINGFIGKTDLPKPISFAISQETDRKGSLVNTDGSLNMRKLSKDLLEDIIVIPSTTKSIPKKIECKPFRKDLLKRKLEAITKKHRIEFIKQSVLEREKALEIQDNQLELAAGRLAQFLESECLGEVDQRKQEAERLVGDENVFTNRLLVSELKALVEFEKKQKKKRRVNASFDLLDIFKDDVIVEKEDMCMYLKIAKPKLAKFNYHQRKKAIENYLMKKRKRKEFGYIRYKVRRELASQRVRCKGKFVKKPKVNLELMAKQYYLNERKGSFDCSQTE